MWGGQQNGQNAFCNGLLSMETSIRTAVFAFFPFLYQPAIAIMPPRMAFPQDAILPNYNFKRRSTARLSFGKTGCFQ
jgi:hypothetical protein